MNIKNGTYQANPTGHVEVGDHANGCLIATMEFALALEDGQKISNTFWLTTKDGAVNTRAIETLKAIFGWDGTDPFWLEDHASELAEIPVELVIENESFTGKDGNKHTSSKVKWVNPVGGGAGENKVMNNDRKALMAKYGAKLRAVSGGTPAKKSIPPPSTPPKATPPPAVEKGVIPPSDMESCWKTLSAGMAEKPRADIEAQWFELLKEVGGDKPQTDYCPAEWGMVMEKIRSMFDEFPF